MTLCTSIDTLAMAYLDDELADEELRDFELHLIDCAACRGRVETEREAIADLRKRLAPPPTPDLVRARVLAALDAEDAITMRAGSAGRWTQWLLPGTATLAAAAALLMFVTMREPAQPREKSAATVVVEQQRQAPQIMPVARNAPGMQVTPTVPGRVQVFQTAKWQVTDGDLRVTTIQYDVVLPWGGEVEARAHTFDSSGINMRSGDRVRIDGVDLYVAHMRDPNGGVQTLVSYDAPGDHGWVFQAANLSEQDLLDLVAYHLLDDVGAR